MYPDELFKIMQTLWDMQPRSQGALLSPPLRPRLWDITRLRTSFKMAAILTAMSLAIALIQLKIKFLKLSLFLA